MSCCTDIRLLHTSRSTILMCIALTELMAKPEQQQQPDPATINQSAVVLADWLSGQLRKVGPPSQFATWISNTLYVYRWRFRLASFPPFHYTPACLLIHRNPHFPINCANWKRDWQDKTRNATIHGLPNSYYGYEAITSASVVSTILLGNILPLKNPSPSSSSGHCPPCSKTGQTPRFNVHAKRHW